MKKDRLLKPKEKAISFTVKSVDLNCALASIVIMEEMISKGEVAAAGADGAAAEEKTEFDVELTEVGPNKVKVIKVVREITGLGLKEAKDAVDGAPKVIKEQLDKASAEDAKAKLEAEGAKVTLK